MSNINVMGGGDLLLRRRMMMSKMQGGSYDGYAVHVVSGKLALPSAGKGRKLEFTTLFKGTTGDVLSYLYNNQPVVGSPMRQGFSNPRGWGSRIHIEFTGWESIAFDKTGMADGMIMGCTIEWGLDGVATATLKNISTGDEWTDSKTPRYDGTEPVYAETSKWSIISWKLTDLATDDIIAELKPDVQDGAAGLRDIHTQEFLTPTDGSCELIKYD